MCGRCGATKILPAESKNIEVPKLRLPKSPRAQEVRSNHSLRTDAIFSRPKASKINKDRQIASGYKKEVAELNCPDSNSLSAPSGAVSSTARRPQGAKYISMLDGRTFDKVQDKVIQSPSGKIRTKSIQHGFHKSQAEEMTACDRRSKL